MRKEVWFAIVGGIALGLVIGFGVYRINSKVNNISEVENSPTPTPVNFSGLAISKPNNDDVITQIPLKVSGITEKNSWVVISTDFDDYVFKSDDKGVFEKDIDLEGGVNQLIISGISSNGVISSQNLRLIYSTQLKTPTGVSTNTSTSTESSNVRETVLKKVEDVLNSPKAYLGTVTDITDSTIQLKSDEGSIEQVSTKENTITVIKESPTAKEVKLTDIAIGDYIIAMGYTNGNHVLSAKRILITSSPEKLNVKITFGKVKSITKKELVINEEKITLPTNQKYSVKLSTIKENDTLIVISQPKDNTQTARTIYLVESNP